jgi:cytochrome P450
MEMTLVLALIAQRYRLRMVSGQVVEPEFRLTLQPRNGLKMYVRER